MATTCKTCFTIKNPHFTHKVYSYVWHSSHNRYQLHKQHKLDGLCNAHTVYSSLRYHYTHIHTMLVLQWLVSEMCCSSLNIPTIQSFKTDTRHKSMQGQKLKSKNICFSTKAPNSDDHKHYCKCISVPVELPASNIRAASLQTEGGTAPSVYMGSHPTRQNPHP